MLNIKSDINQQDFKIVNLYFVESESFSPTWSCESRQRETTSNVWKFQLKYLTFWTVNLDFRLQILEVPTELLHL